MALPKEKWPGARYAMLFVVAAGLYPPLCGVVAWNGEFKVLFISNCY